MTDCARATPTGKIAKTEATRAALRVAQCGVTREHDTERAQMSKRNCAMSADMFAPCCREPRVALPATQHEDRGWLARRIEGRCCKAQPTDVFPMGLFSATGRDYAISGAALPFRPGGT